MSVEKQYCTFFVNSLLFGVEAFEVQEILAYRKVIRVPLSSKTIAGLVNHRGHILTVIDTHERLGFPEKATSQLTTVLVARCEDETVGLLVDKVSDVLWVSDNDFEPVPENLRKSAKDLVTGAYKLPKQLLLPLNLKRIAETTNNEADRRTHPL